MTFDKCVDLVLAFLSSFRVAAMCSGEIKLCVLRFRKSFSQRENIKSLNNSDTVLKGST